jgi:hypothetical protein
LPAPPHPAAGAPAPDVDASKPQPPREGRGGEKTDPPELGS